MGLSSGEVVPNDKWQLSLHLYQTSLICLPRRVNGSIRLALEAMALNSGSHALRENRPLLDVLLDNLVYRRIGRGNRLKHLLSIILL
jgi:hypothetical protein